MKNIKRLGSLICLLCLVFCLVACDGGFNLPNNENGSKGGESLREFVVNFDESEVTGELTVERAINIALEQLESQFIEFLDSIEEERDKKILELAFVSMKNKITACSGTVEEVVAQITEICLEFNNVINLINENIDSFETMKENALNKVEVVYNSVNGGVSATKNEIVTYYNNAKETITNVIEEGDFKKAIYDALDEFVNYVYAYSNGTLDELVDEYIEAFKVRLYATVESTLNMINDETLRTELQACYDREISALASVTTLRQFYEVSERIEETVYIEIDRVTVAYMNVLVAEAKEKVNYLLDDLLTIITDEDKVAEIERFRIEILASLDDAVNCNNIPGVVEATAIAIEKTDMYKKEVEENYLRTLKNNAINELGELVKDIVESLTDEELKNNILSFLDKAIFRIEEITSISNFDAEYADIKADLLNKINLALGEE